MLLAILLASFMRPAAAWLLESDTINLPAVAPGANSVDLHLKLTRDLHLKLTHPERQIMA